MVQINLLLFMCCVGSFVRTIAAEDWQRTFQKSTWEISLTRRTVDTQITMETLEAKTVTECSFACSDGMGVQALSFYFVQKIHTCHCNMALDTNPEDNNVAQIHYGALQTLYKKEEIEEHFDKYTVWPFLSSCLSLHAVNFKQDAVYRIDPIGGAVTDTWCDMTNGGWTVIQRRLDGSEDFYRDWADYVNGFGNRNGEYWLGLENIHHLTKAGSHIEFFLEAFPGVTPPNMTAHYTNFVVDDASSYYTLHVSGFTGNCGDAFKFHDGYPFSTYDNDNDIAYSENCAAYYGGGFWYQICHEANVNGLYYQAGEYSYGHTLAKGIQWFWCWRYQHSAKSSVMKIRSPLN